MIADRTTLVQDNKFRETLPGKQTIVLFWPEGPEEEKAPVRKNFAIQNNENELSTHSGSTRTVFVLGGGLKFGIPVNGTPFSDSIYPKRIPIVSVAIDTVNSVV